MEESRIYAVVAGTIQVPVNPGSHRPPLRTVIQPAGRQIAQACHVVSKLRWQMLELNKDLSKIPTRELISIGYSLTEFIPLTTIILQARDSAETAHVYTLLDRKKLKPVIFSDNNPEYGPGDWPTAVAVFATPKQVKYILNYLPLWGSK